MKKGPGVVVSVEADPAAEDLAVVARGLGGFNELHATAGTRHPLALLARDGSGKIVGGLVGYTHWGWLHVSQLWVAEQLRGEGLGSELLSRAEEEARGRGCHHVHLDTLSFQARPFYERHGYEVFGVLEDFPRGHSRYFLAKSLER